LKERVEGNEYKLSVKVLKVEIKSSAAFEESDM
jgi:hypothetical protein